jgi:hypothetical protein
MKIKLVRASLTWLVLLLVLALSTVMQTSEPVAAG